MPYALIALACFYLLAVTLLIVQPAWMFQTLPDDLDSGGN